MLTILNLFEQPEGLIFARVSTWRQSEVVSHRDLESILFEQVGQTCFLLTHIGGIWTSKTSLTLNLRIDDYTCASQFLQVGNPNQFPPIKTTRTQHDTDIG